MVVVGCVAAGGGQVQCEEQPLSTASVTVSNAQVRIIEFFINLASSNKCYCNMPDDISTNTL